MIRCSVSAVMNAPITGPSDRLYGNLIVACLDAVVTRGSLSSTDGRRGP